MGSEQQSQFNLRPEVYKLLDKISNSSEEIRVSQRDILDYLVIKEFSKLLLECSEAISSERSYSRPVLISLFKNIREKYFLSSVQYEAITNVVNQLIEEIDNFESWLSGKLLTDVRNNFGERLKILEEDVEILHGDYPGVIQVKVSNPEEYKKLKNNEAEAFYSSELGIGQLKGHVIVLSGSASSSTSLHEYQHFLQNFTLNQIHQQIELIKKRNSTETSTNLIQKEKKHSEKQSIKKSLTYEERVEEHQNAIVDLEFDLEESFEEPMQCIEIQKQIEEHKKALQDLESQRYRALRRRMFVSYKKELMAYSMGSQKLPVILKDLFKRDYALLENNQQSKNFLEQMEQLAECIKDARSIGVDAKQLAFLVSLTPSIAKAIQVVTLKKIEFE